MVSSRFGNVPDDMDEFAKKYAECLWLEEREIRNRTEAIVRALNGKKK